MITPADLLAMADVIDQAIEESDSLALEQALPLKEAAEEVQRKLRTLVSLVSTQTLKVLDGQPKKVGDTIYYEQEDGKWRPDQKRIRNVVAARAAMRAEESEGLGAEDLLHEAGRAAVDMMYDLFVAPKDMPKSTGLKKLGLQKSDVAEWEVTGRSLASTRVGGEHD